MRILLTLIVLLLGPLPASAETYISLSYGIAQENHDFDIWHSRQYSARRQKFTAHGSAHDWAVGVGLRRGAFDFELNLFDQKSGPFAATDIGRTYQTEVATRGILGSVWKTLGTQNAWMFKGGAGLGYRESSYVMRGPGTNIHTTDRAPYAMLGMRVMRPLTDSVSLFGDVRGNFRPPVRLKSGGVMRAPLEHDSSGLSLHIGLQIALN